MSRVHMLMVLCVRTLFAMQEDLAREIQGVNRSNINDKGRIMQSPGRVKRKIQDMAASSDALKPLITRTEGVRTQLQAKDNVLRGLIQVLSAVLYSCEGHRHLASHLGLEGGRQGFGESKSRPPGPRDRQGSVCGAVCMQTQRQAHYKILTTQLTVREIGEVSNERR